jgi:hypothetical protein
MSRLKLLTLADHLLLSGKKTTIKIRPQNVTTTDDMPWFTVMRVKHSGFLSCIIHVDVPTAMPLSEVRAELRIL